MATAGQGRLGRYFAAILAVGMGGGSWSRFWAAPRLHGHLPHALSSRLSILTGISRRLRVALGVGCGVLFLIGFIATADSPPGAAAGLIMLWFVGWAIWLTGSEVGLGLRVAAEDMRGDWMSPSITDESEE